VEQAVSVSTCHHGIESLTNSNVCPPVEMTYIDQPHRQPTAADIHWFSYQYSVLQLIIINIKLRSERIQLYTD